MGVLPFNNNNNDDIYIFSMFTARSLNKFFVQAFCDSPNMFLVRAFMTHIMVFHKYFARAF